MGNFMIFLLTKYFCSDHIQKNEMGWSYSTYGGKESCIQGFDGETGVKVVTRKT
jgi:hypothetical protein